jgi:hypothetical protein
MLLTRRSSLWLALAALLFAGIAAFSLWPRSPHHAFASISPTSGRGLASFQSDDELRAFLRKAASRGGADHNEVVQDSVSAAPPPLVATQAEPSARVAAPPSEQGITNNQEAGVDEGGIVKNYRDMLVILRRGRVFTMSLADGGMRPIDSINAFPPGVSGRGDWYDEMLVSGDRIVVIGYSYARGGTEVNRFRITPDGRLRFEDAYHLRSNDYYSSRNYASRLIGNRLIYYTPLYLGTAGADPLEALPGVRRWGRDGSTRAFRRITQARQVFIAPRLRDDEEAPIEALHSVINCDLTAPELDCEATAVLGPSSRSFYVSGNAVYLFVSDGWRRREQAASSHIYRLPFAQGERPSAIGARGAPVDQFSFREDAQDGRLDVLVRASGGDAMWRPEASAGAVALLQVPLRDFGDGSEEADRSLYRDLPSPPRNSYDFHNRFVGNYLLYGSGDMDIESGPGGGARARQAEVVAVPVEGRGAFQLALPHGVQRIEGMGSDALVIGPMGGALGFTAIHLGGREPRVGERYVQRAAAEGESRSHAFFFSADAASPDGASGTIGLPVSRPVEPRYRRHFGTAAAMLFLRRDQRSFSPAGELDARPSGTGDDGCQASCVDWYGNARPIFLSGRVFALLGYELVEGSLGGGRINEIRRVSFAPTMASARRR